MLSDPDLALSTGLSITFRRKFVMNFDFGIFLQIVTLVTVIAGSILGIMEVRRARQVRSDKGARDVLSLAVSPDHIEAAYGILELPIDARPELVKDSPE